MTAVLGAVAVFAVTSGSAATTTKPYTASFAPIPPVTVAGGSLATITLTLTNLANPQSLGSANVTAAALGASSFTITGATPSAYLDPTQSFPASLLKLRNLNVPPNGGQRFITINVATPCAAGDYTWGVRAKQSNDFSGPPGNDFTFRALGSNLITKVDACLELRFVTQPKKTVVGATITDADYSAGGPVTVGLFNSGTNQQLASCPASLANVTLSRSPGDGTLTGNTASLGGSPCSASFGSVSIGNVAASALPKSFTLTASGVGTATPTSDAFQVINGTNCVGQDPCTITGTGGSSGRATGGSFLFVAFESLELGYLPAGCAEFQSVGEAPLFVAEQRSALSGELFVTYGIRKSLLDKKYADTSGQQFIPICAGAKRIKLVAGRTQPVDCDEEYPPGVPQATTADLRATGWWGKELGTSGPSKGKFTGRLSQAVCDPGTGFFFGILGSFQDYTGANVIDPSTNPTVTGWSSDNTYRYFTSRWPSASGSGPFATVPWDGWKFG